MCDEATGRAGRELRELDEALVVCREPKDRECKSRSIVFSSLRRSRSIADGRIGCGSMVHEPMEGVQRDGEDREE